jgi:hypothetical protein
MLHCRPRFRSRRSAEPATLPHDDRRRVVLLWHLPNDALIEFAVWRRLRLWFALVLRGIYDSGAVWEPSTNTISAIVAMLPGTGLGVTEAVAFAVYKAQAHRCLSIFPI